SRARCARGRSGAAALKSTRARPMRILAGLIVFALALAHAPAALAHAALVRAEPADGAVVAQPPASLKLTFNEPVSPLVMRLVGPNGEVMAPTSVTADNTV